MKRKFWNKNRKIGGAVLITMWLLVNLAHFGTMGTVNYDKYGKVPDEDRFPRYYGEIDLKSWFIGFLETSAILLFLLWMIGLPELGPQTKEEYRKMRRGG